jgi:UDP-hydrolysing UDP-N-acetyl-D-glucosamine 2-epimerase
LANIPIAHISGGEVTEGVIDNQVRNALTKMAHLHYPALPEYAENIISMGEEEWRVKAAGEPGLDALSTMTYLSREDFYKLYSIDPELGFVISTFHPETIHNSVTVAKLDEIFDSVLAEYSGQILVTSANSDHYGRVINDFLIEKSKTTPRFHFKASLGQVNFYSSLKYADFMLGNSSSGIVESQSFHLPVINVGTRQQGRITNENVVHVVTETNQILKAVKLVLSEDFKNKVSSMTNRYGRGDSARTILKHIADHIDRPNLLLKKGVFKSTC